MRVLLRLQDIHFLDRSPHWWHNPEVLGAILGSIERHGLLEGLRLYGPSGKKRKKLTSVAALVQSSLEWKAGAYSLTSEEADLPAAELFLDLKLNALTLMLSFNQTALAQHQGNLISQMLAVVCDIHDAFGERVMLGPLADIEVLEADYPKTRPPRFHRVFLPGVLAMVICQQFHQRHRQGTPADVQKLLAAPLPAGVQRYSHGDLVILRWAEDVADEPYVQERRSLQDQWLSQVLEMSVKSSYNELGDHALPPLGQDDDLLTFYNASRREGAKAVVVFGDGTVDEQLFAELESWVQQRKLPDGRALERLNLILPSRDAALQIRERATQLGAKGVYYMDDQGQLWNPFPPGLWREASA